MIGKTVFHQREQNLIEAQMFPCRAVSGRKSRTSEVKERESRICECPRRFSGAPAGPVGWHVPRHPILGGGFTVAPEYHRQGFGAEAVTGLLEHLFTVLNKHRVFASVDPQNEASMALLNKIGMRQEAHFRQSLFFKGEWVDDVVFGILRSEWLNR